MFVIKLFITKHPILFVLFVHGACFVYISIEEDNFWLYLGWEFREVKVISGKFGNFGSSKLFRCRGLKILQWFNMYLCAKRLRISFFSNGLWNRVILVKYIRVGTLLEWIRDLVLKMQIDSQIWKRFLKKIHLSAAILVGRWVEDYRSLWASILLRRRFPMASGGPQ